MVQHLSNQFLHQHHQNLIMIFIRKYLALLKESSCSLIVQTHCL